MMSHTVNNSEVSVSSSIVSQAEVEKMAGILRKRYGVHAYAAAARFVEEHIEIDDETHADAWSRVAQFIFETTEIQ